MKRPTLILLVLCWLIPSAANAQLREMRQTIFGMD